MSAKVPVAVRDVRNGRELVARVLPVFVTGGPFVTAENRMQREEESGLETALRFGK